jgi:hypothetical protein
MLYEFRPRHDVAALRPALISVKLLPWPLVIPPYAALDPSQSRVLTPVLILPERSEGELVMPTIDAFIIVSIVLMFIVFGAVLAWADYQSRHVRWSDVAKMGKKAAAMTTNPAQAVKRKEFTLS